MTGDVAVPLEAVRVEARLVGACVDVTVTQRYRNTESVPVEAVYVFPLEERAAVCGFSATVGGKVIRGQVDEREAAFAQYDDAMARGDGAFLLDQERPNVFTASVGNLKAGESVELQIRYVALATREGEAVRFGIPTTVSPRYVPKGGPEVGEPDGDRVNPPRKTSVPYGLTLSVVVEGSGLRRVESPSHPIRTTLGPSSTTVELARDDVALDRDFVLLVERNEPEKPEARVAREADGRRVAMVTFLPRLPKSGEQGHEVLFLLDCSGSMGGESIDQARRALSLCVRALGPEDTFNVVCFGTQFRAMWPVPRRYDDASLDEATKYISKIDANFGGTEILAPLKSLLEAKQDSARPRRVLVLTDGQVSNEDEVLALSREHAGTSRIFAFGIGAGASEHLVRGMARASRGGAEMIFPGERIEPKVLRTFERVRTPVFDDTRVDWKGLKVEQAPARVLPVFSGDALTVFARIESGASSDVELVVGGEKFVVPLDLERAEAEGPIPVLWAREAILELDDTSMRRGSAQKRPETEERRRARLVELGKRYGLVNSATSFVAVEERSAADQVTSPAALRKIPVALTSGWGGGQRGGGHVGAMFVARAPMMAAPPPGMPPPAPMPVAASAPPGFFARARASFGGSAPPPAAAPRMSAPSSAKGSAPAQSVSDSLYDVLMTQKASGSFTSSGALEKWLGAERSARLKKALAGASTDEAVMVTTVVVTILEKEQSDREAEWRPAVNKARAWLARQSSSFDASAVL